MHTSVLVADELAAAARELGINLSEAAHEGLRNAVRKHRAELDRQAYQAHPEPEERAWEDVEAFGDA